MTSVSVSLKELKEGIPLPRLEQAFGPDSLGIIIVKDLPPEFHDLRLKVLQSASKLANLPSEELRRLESPESTWLVGWSCGKEKFNDEPDTSKGSWYVNCSFHKDPKLEAPVLPKEFDQYKTYVTPNIWPAPNGDMVDFQLDLKKLINMIIDVAGIVAENCDNYISNTYSDYESGFLKSTVENSTCSKARLLHYFPKTSTSPSKNEDDWCGEHLDHSCITGLTSALFIDESTNTVMPKSPDPEAGLYIKNRQNEVVKVNIPSDCLAFQTGSALQEVSRNQFKAVPHYVKGTNLPSIARNTLAVFCQPNLDVMVNDKENFAQFSDRTLKSNH